MNDHELEDELSKIPTPTLPVAWRAEILANARRTSAKQSPWNFIQIFRRQAGSFFRENPFSIGALAALWFLIFFFRVTQPATDPYVQNQVLALEKQGSPVHFHSVLAETRLVEALDQKQEQEPEPSLQ